MPVRAPGDCALNLRAQARLGTEGVWRRGVSGQVEGMGRGCVAPPWCQARLAFAITVAAGKGQEGMGTMPPWGMGLRWVHMLSLSLFQRGVLRMM